MQLLELIFGKRNNVKVLRHLISHENWQFNITELSKDTGLNKGVLSRLINNLEKENIIKLNRKGKIKLFFINKENVFIKDVIMPVFEKEKNFYYEILKKSFEHISRDVVSVVVYGSIVSGKFKLTSDIDVLVLFENENKELNVKLENIRKEFLEKDLLLNLDLINVNEFKKLFKRKEPFIISVLKNHKVLYGNSLEEILSEKRK